VSHDSGQRTHYEKIDRLDKYLRRHARFPLTNLLLDLEQLSSNHSHAEIGIIRAFKIAIYLDDPEVSQPG
jgi:hypothetical protein